VLLNKKFIAETLKIKKYYYLLKMNVKKNNVI